MNDLLTYILVLQTCFYVTCYWDALDYTCYSYQILEGLVVNITKILSMTVLTMIQRSHKLTHPLNFL